MKKLFTLIAIALMGVANLQAQTVTINKKDGSSVTFETKDIKDIKFVPAAQATKRYIQEKEPSRLEVCLVLTPLKVHPIPSLKMQTVPSMLQLLKRNIKAYL